MLVEEIKISGSLGSTKTLKSFTKTQFTKKDAISSDFHETFSRESHEGVF